MSAEIQVPASVVEAKRWRTRFMMLYMAGFLAAGFGPLIPIFLFPTAAEPLMFAWAAVLGLAAFGPFLFARKRIENGARLVAAWKQVQTQSDVAALQAGTLPPADDHPIVARITALDKMAGVVAHSASERLAAVQTELSAIASAGGDMPALTQLRIDLEADKSRIEAELANLYAAVVEGERSKSEDVVARLEAEAEAAAPRPPDRQTS